VGTTLFQTANKKEDYKPEVFKTIASALGIDMPVCKNHPECEWSIQTNPWQTDMYLRAFDGVPTELMYHRDCMPPKLMGDIAAAPARPHGPSPAHGEESQRDLGALRRDGRRPAVCLLSTLKRASTNVYVLDSVQRVSYERWAAVVKALALCTHASKIQIICVRILYSQLFNTCVYAS
jgi:hypothetical protein